MCTSAAHMRLRVCVIEWRVVEFGFPHSPFHAIASQTVSYCAFYNNRRIIKEPTS